jgi:hypothetical protein
MPGSQDVAVFLLFQAGYSPIRPNSPVTFTHVHDGTPIDLKPGRSKQVGERKIMIVVNHGKIGDPLLPPTSAAL